MKVRVRSSLVVAGILGISVLLTGCGKKEMLTVNGEKVTRDQFYSRLEQVPVQTNYGVRPAGNHVVRKLIDEMLILQYAEKKGVPATEEQVSARIERLKKQGIDPKAYMQANGLSSEDYKKQQAVEQAFVNVVSKNVDLTDAEVQKAYQDALKDPKSGLKSPARVSISIISCKKDKLPLVQKRLNSGENFNMVAKELSDDPTGKKTNGVLTVPLYQGMPNVPPIMVKTAFSTAVGKFSDPVPFEGKLYIIKVDRKFEPKVTSFDEIKEVIRERMAMAKGMKRSDFREDMKKFIVDSKIDIRSGNYKSISKEIKEEADNPNAEAPAGNKP